MGPYGGEAVVVTVHPKTDALLAASLHGRLFRSQDGGAHWLSRPFPAELNSKVHAILFDSISDSNNDRSYLLAVSHDHASGSGLYKTTDDGITWQASPEFRGRSVWALATFPGNPQVIAAGATDGVYLTKNGGQNWQRISPSDKGDLQPVVSVAFDPTDAHTIFAGTPHLPWRTKDEGSTWTSIHTGMIDDSDVFSLAPALQQPGRLFASACTGIYRSDDRGEHWLKLRGSTEASYRTYVIFPDPSPYSSLSSRVYAGTTGGLQRSLDGGVTWQRVYAGAVKSVVSSHLHPLQLYAATMDAGLIRSDDGGDTFRPINEGFEGHAMNGLFTASNALFVAGQNGAAVQYPSSTGWQTIKPADAFTFMAGSSPSQILSASAHTLWLSDNGGHQWKQIPAPAQRGSLTGLALLADGTGAKLWVATTAGLFEGSPGGSPGGSRWKAVPVPALENQPIRVMTASKSRIIVASRGHAAISSDRGASWALLPLPIAGLEWEGFAFSPVDDHLVAATSHGLFLHQSSGDQWSQSLGAQAATTSGIFFHPQFPNLAFAAQQSSVLYSMDGGHAWQILPRAGMAVAAQIKSLTIIPSQPQRIIALVARRGLYTTLIDPEVLSKP